MKKKGRHGTNDKNPFVEALAASTALALFMISVAMGIMNIASTKTTPVPIAVILLIFAIVFIIGSVFFENRGADHSGSMIGGAIASFIVTFSATAFLTGLAFVMSEGFKQISWEQILSSLAVCMIASMLIIKMLKHKISSLY